MPIDDYRYLPRSFAAGYDSVPRSDAPVPFTPLAVALPEAKVALVTTAGIWNRLGPYEVNITDGVIDVGTYGGSANFSGIEVWRMNTTGAARVASQPKMEATGRLLSVFPSPATDRIRVQTPVPADQITGTQVADATGKVYLQNGHRLTGAQELEMNVAMLKKGLYFLRIQSGEGSQMVKFLKQ